MILAVTVQTPLEAQLGLRLGIIWPPLIPKFQLFIKYDLLNFRHLIIILIDKET